VSLDTSAPNPAIDPTAPATPDAIGAPDRPKPKPTVSATKPPSSAQSAPVKPSHSPSPIDAKSSAF
jgi:hypothetical protein